MYKYKLLAPPEHRSAGCAQHCVASSMLPNALARTHTIPTQTMLYQNQNNTRQHKAMNDPSIIPSLLFLLPILCINPLIPGICAAAPVIRRCMLIKLSLCSPKLSFVAYACDNTESTML